MSVDPPYMRLTSTVWSKWEVLTWEVKETLKKKTKRKVPSTIRCRGCSLCFQFQGTTNMDRHKDKCAEIVSSKAAIIKVRRVFFVFEAIGSISFLLLNQMQVTQTAFEEMLVGLVVDDGVSLHAITNSMHIKTLANMLSSDLSLPCRNTISKRIIDAKQKFKTELIHTISKCDRISLTFDIWSSSKVGMRAYLGITVHFVENHNLVSTPARFRLFKSKHDGYHISLALKEFASEFRCLNKIRSITCDNAAENTKALRLFESHCIVENAPFRCSTGNIRCFSHILNIAAQSALSVLKQETKKIRCICKRAKKSTTFSEELSRVAEVELAKPLKLLTDCKTRWNSCVLMLRRASMFRQVHRVR
jgi:hypothetical protein